MSQIYFRCHSASCPRAHISCFVCTLNTNVMSNNPPFFPPFKKNIKNSKTIISGFWWCCWPLLPSRTHTQTRTHWPLCRHLKGKALRHWPGFTHMHKTPPAWSVNSVMEPFIQLLVNLWITPHRRHVKIAAAIKVSSPPPLHVCVCTRSSCCERESSARLALATAL